MSLPANIVNVCIQQYRKSIKIKLQICILISLGFFLLCLNLINSGEVRSELSQSTQRHILERLSFGINSEQIKQIETEGIEAYIQSQLNPQLISESPKLNKYLTQIISVNKHPFKNQKKNFANKQKLKNKQLSLEQQLAIKKSIRKVMVAAKHEAVDAHVVRAIDSRRQLQEVMVDFWFNHFNVFANKGNVGLWVNDYESKIRANALGNFRDLLEATASHPAMLIYLDNQQNRVPLDPQTKKPIEKLNENYARELMELHTLGVDGGYTQADIVALAKIFTGWGIDLKGNKGSKNGFVFYQNHHDQSEKIFLGHKINEPGKANDLAEGQKALDILATHPATAHLIGYKLAQYFVADRPPSSLVNKLAQTFLQSNGDIKVVLNALFHSQEFNDPQYYGQKFKTPYQYIISLLRMSEIEQLNLKRIRGILHHLSMPVHLCDTPAGYKNTQEAWLNPQAMLQRISLASAIARGDLNLKKPIKYERLENNLGQLSQRTKQTIAKNPPQMRSALLLGSPEAMYR